MSADLGWLAIVLLAGGAAALWRLHRPRWRPLAWGAAGALLACLASLAGRCGCDDPPDYPVERPPDPDGVAARDLEAKLADAAEAVKTGDAGRADAVRDGDVNAILNDLDRTGPR